MATTKINGARQIEASSITNAVQNFGTPSASTDVAIKSYVDSVAQGLDTKPSAVAATVAVLSPTNTYANGSSGVGATLTATANGVLTVDGYSTLLNDYILVKNEASGLKNGLYKVTTQGTAGVPYVLTRAIEMDVTTEYSGGFIFIEQGSTLSATGWVCTNSTNPTVGTTAINFAQFSGAGTYTSGTGLTLTGSAFSVNTSQNISTLSNLTSNGLVKTSGGTGALSIATSGTDYAPATSGTAVLKGNGSGGFSTALNSDLPVMSATVGGAVPTPPNNTTTFLRGDGTFATPTISKYFRANAVSGTQNSSNKVFTLANTPDSGSEQIFMNGQLLTPGSGNDYTLSGVTVTMDATFTAPASSDTLRAYSNY